MNRLLISFLFLISFTTVAKAEFSNGAIGFSVEKPLGWYEFDSPEQGASLVPIAYLVNNPSSNGDAVRPNISIIFVPLRVFSDKETGRYTEVVLKRMEQWYDLNILDPTKSITFSGLPGFHTRFKFTLPLKDKPVIMVTRIYEVHRGDFAFVITSNAIESSDQRTFDEIQLAIDSIEISKYKDNSFPAYILAQKLGTVEQELKTAQLSMRSGASDAVPKEQRAEISKQLLAMSDCVANLDTSISTDLYASYTGVNFSKNYKLALQFIESDEGQNWLKSLHFMRRQKAGLSASEKKPEMSESDWHKAMTFARTFDVDDPDSHIVKVMLPTIYLEQQKNLIQKACGQGLGI